MTGANRPVRSGIPSETGAPDDERLSTLPLSFFFSLRISRTIAPDLSAVASTGGLAASAAAASGGAASAGGSTSTGFSASATGAGVSSVARWPTLRIFFFPAGGSSVTAAVASIGTSLPAGSVAARFSVTVASGSPTASTWAASSAPSSTGSSRAASSSTLPALRMVMLLEMAPSSGVHSGFFGFGLVTRFLEICFWRSAFFSTSWLMLVVSLRWAMTLPTNRSSMGWLAEKTITPIFFSSLRIILASRLKSSAS